MHEAGAPVCLKSDSNELMRHLYQEAANCLKYGGMSEVEALKTITYNGAVQLGVDKRVGSIEVGKDADIAIWNNHPLSVYASPDYVFIDGEVFFDRQQDLAKRAQLEQQRAALERAEENRAAGRNATRILP